MKYKNKETIICSAVWWKEFELNKDIPVSHVLPTNLNKGIVTCGFRHLHCIYSMLNFTGKQSVNLLGEHEQGFLTSHNRFVTREEGAEIHKDNGGTLNFSPTRLFSEDLY